jgi:multidrug efflux pump subunit AcrA (membrane-fusion protein)
MKTMTRLSVNIAKSGVLLAATTGLLLAGCGSAEKEKEPVVSVQTAPAQQEPISQTITTEAVVFPLEQATVAPKITSTIKKFFVQRGARVHKGQLLAQLENADLAATAESSKGDYEQAEATYVMTVGAGLPQQIQKAELDAASAKAAFDAQQKIYDSRKDLLQQGAIPRRDFESAEVALAQARSQNEQAQKQLADLHRLGKEQLLKSAQGSKESQEGKYRAAAAQLSYSMIKSPIDGVVTDRPPYEGDLATANQPILTVMNLSRLIAKAHIPQAEAVQLKVGNPAEITVAGLDEPIKARVSLVSPALDPGSTTVEVWVEARKPDPALRPGMTVPVSMTAKTAKDAIVVPAPAVFHGDEAGDYVLVAGSDNKAHQKKVQVGVRNKEAVQIVSGLNAGEPVITVGGYGVPDGTQIKVEAPEKEESAGADDEKDKKGDKKDDDKSDEKSAKKGGKADSAAAKPGKGKE